MNLIVGAPWWLVAFLCLLLVAAAVEDAIRLKISNLTCIAVFVGALVAMAVHGFSWPLWQNGLVCLAILVVGTPLFAAGWLGGGDVKLLAALGTWLNLSAAVGLIVAVLLAGGLISVVYIVIWRMTGRRRQSGNRIPYGLAIAAGAFFIVGVQWNARPSNPFIDQLRAIQTTKHA